jgi:AbrB family transcriptional regulator (stage V sporulation protein T)
VKATGIVRRIDDLGRVVIPKEIRRTMRIREGDPLEIYTDRDGEVIFKKYSPIGELGNFATQYAETLSKTSGHPIVITDKDSIIAVSGASKKELAEKKVSSELEHYMEEKSSYTLKSGETKKIPIIDGIDKYIASVVYPIISEGDTVGSVVFVSDSSTTPSIGEVEEKLAQAASSFLGKQMEQ